MVKDIWQRLGKFLNLNKVNTRDAISRDIKVTLLKIKDKEKMLEAARGRKTYDLQRSNSEIVS